MTTTTCFALLIFTSSINDLHKKEIWHSDSNLKKVPKNGPLSVQYFDEDSAFPVPFSFLNIFPLTVKAFLRWKKPTEVQRKYTFTKQAEARKSYMELMLALINRLKDQGKNYREEWKQEDGDYHKF